MNKVREGSREWSEAQSEGLRAANGVANDLVLLQTLLVQDRSVTKALDDLEKAGEDGKLVGLRAATVARLKERLKDGADEISRVVENLRESLKLLRAGREDLHSDHGMNSLGLEASASKRLMSEQPVYWTVAPNAYLKKVDSVLASYEKEMEAKAAVNAFFQELVTSIHDEDTDIKAFLKDHADADRVKVHLVVWMLESELDLQSLEDLEDLYNKENKLCKVY